MMRFSRRGERAPPLGALELAVMKQIWAHGAAIDARDLHLGLAARRISLSTVQATLERLHRKGLLARSKVQRAYRYAAAVSQTKLIGTLIRDVAERLAHGELEPVISGFVDLLHEADPQLLERVQSQVTQRRKDAGA